MLSQEKAEELFIHSTSGKAHGSGEVGMGVDSFKTVVKLILAQKDLRDSKGQQPQQVQQAILKSQRANQSTRFNDHTADS